MIIVEVGRGLGNSMHVYAAGLALAKRNNTLLKIDTSFLNAWPRLKYKFGGSWDVVIEKFNITSKKAKIREVNKFIFRTGFRPLDRFLYKYKLFERRVIHFKTTDSIEKFKRIPNNSYVFGYFGNANFLKDIKDELKKEFSLQEKYKNPIKEKLEKISKENSVSLHVRRGDVLEFKNANVMDGNYYKKAMSIIGGKIKNPTYYVFSDDIEWCKKNLKELSNNLIFMEGNKDYEDLELMKSCKHNILANSALSWWAGYLNENKEKIVIAPQNFSHFKNNNTGKELPKDWILI